MKRTEEEIKERRRGGRGKRRLGEGGRKASEGMGSTERREQEGRGEGREGRGEEGRGSILANRFPGLGVVPTVRWHSSRPKRHSSQGSTFLQLSNRRPQPAFPDSRWLGGPARGVLCPKSGLGATGRAAARSGSLLCVRGGFRDLVPEPRPPQGFLAVS